MTADLRTQTRDLFTEVDASQDSISVAEIVTLAEGAEEFVGLAADRQIQPLQVRPQRRRWRSVWAAVVAAIVTLVLVGGVALLSRQGEDNVVDQSTTTTIQSTTTTTAAEPTEFDIEGFAPWMSGLGLEDGTSNSFTLGSQDFPVGDTTFAVWEGTWGIDWRDVVKSVVDDSTKLLIENPQGSGGEVGREWIPEQGILDFYWWGSKESFAQLSLVFSGTSDDWVIDVSEEATGNSAGSIEGSLPGLDEEQIMAAVAGGLGRVGWFFVSDGEEQVPVTPPWTSYFAPGGSRFVVVGEAILAFIVTGEDGPGQMTIWRSTDGETWEDLGWTPWLGHIYAIDTLFERNGEILALVFNSGERPSSEEEGTIHYWSSSDGANWVELTKEEWDQKSGAIEPDNSDLIKELEGAAPTGDTPLPDVAGAVPGDDGAGPVPLGTVSELPDSRYLNFLNEDCGYSDDGTCFRDAVFVDPSNLEMESGPPVPGQPFHVRHGFINNSEEPLGPGFDVVLYAFPMTENRVEIGPTSRYTSDYVSRGISDECGPTYRILTERETCEWFVHDFPDGLPAGRWALWAVWEAPCSAWLELGFTDSCDDPSGVMSLFSSGHDSPYTEPDMYAGDGIDL